MLILPSFVIFQFLYTIFNIKLCLVTMRWFYLQQVKRTNLIASDRFFAYQLWHYTREGKDLFELRPQLFKGTVPCRIFCATLQAPDCSRVRSHNSLISIVWLVISVRSQVSSKRMLLTHMQVCGVSPQIYTHMPCRTNAGNKSRRLFLAVAISCCEWAWRFLWWLLLQRSLKTRDFLRTHLHIVAIVPRSLWCWFQVKCFGM